MMPAVTRHTSDQGHTSALTSGSAVNLRDVTRPLRSLPPVRWWVWCAVFAALVTGAASMVELSAKTCAPITMADPESPWVATAGDRTYLKMDPTAFPATHC